MTDRPDDVVRPDPRALRALAHPLRLRLLGLLRAEGPATATGLAALTGESTGTTSYHLRQLERHGLVLEDAARGNGRDRWWRAAHRMTSFDGPDAATLAAADDDVREELLAVGDQYLRVVAEGYARQVGAAISALPTLDDDLGAGWQRAFTLNDYALRLTLDEALALAADLEAVVERYRSDDPGRRDGAPAGTQRVAVQVNVLPHVPARPHPAGADG